MDKYSRERHGKAPPFQAGQVVKLEATQDETPSMPLTLLWGEDLRPAASVSFPTNPLGRTHLKIAQRV